MEAILSKSFCANQVLIFFTSFIIWCFHGLQVGIFSILALNFTVLLLHIANTKKSLLLSFTFILFFILSYFLHGVWLTVSLLNLIIFLTVIFYALRIILNDPFISIFVMLLIAFFVSFIPFQFATNVLLAIAIFSILLSCLNYKKIISMIQQDFFLLQQLMLIDLVVWAMIFLFILFSGLKAKGDFIGIDNCHPLYECSIGQSFSKGIFNAPNLSYKGISVRYHFLSTQLPLLLSNIFNVSKIESLYLLMPFFFFIISFFTYNFFVLLPGYYIPIAVLLFLPTHMAVGMNFSLFTRSFLIGMSSFSAGFILVLLACYFFLKKKNFLFFIAASVLLLTKGSFFITLFLGIMFYLLLEKKYFKIIFFGGVLFSIFVLIYKLFLSGAHQELLWIFFPSIVYHSLLAPYIKHQTSYPLNFVLFLFLVLVTYRFYTPKVEEKLKFFASLCLASMVMRLLLTDTVCHNASQFHVAVFIPFNYIIWHYLKNFNFSYVVQKLSFFNSLCCKDSFIKFLKSTCIVIFCFWVLDSCIVNLYSYYRVGWRVMHPQYYTYPMKKDVINAYSWLEKNISDDSTVLFGRHYVSNSLSIKHVGEHDAIRSALSGKQMFCEGFIGKSICMQENFSSRFVDVINFYRKFVILSDDSKTRIANYIHGNFSDQKGVALSKDRSLMKRALYYLSFGKEWCYHNKVKQVPYEIKQKLTESVLPSEHEAIMFLQQNGITHVILENYDKPTTLLDNITKVIYHIDSIAILEVVGLNKNMQCG